MYFVRPQKHGVDQLRLATLYAWKPILRKYRLHDWLLVECAFIGAAHLSATGRRPYKLWTMGLNPSYITVYDHANSKVSLAPGLKALTSKWASLSRTRDAPQSIYAQRWTGSSQPDYWGTSPGNVYLNETACLLIWSACVPSASLFGHWINW